jgi:hypothetical protein
MSNRVENIRGSDAAAGSTMPAILWRVAANSSAGVLTGVSSAARRRTKKRLRNRGPRNRENIFIDLKISYIARRPKPVLSTIVLSSSGSSKL